MPKVVQLGRNKNGRLNPKMEYLICAVSPSRVHCLPPGERPHASIPRLGARLLNGALPRLHASPDGHRDQLSTDESRLHLGCHRMFSSSKYGSASSKWSSELITNGLKSQSHLRNSHVQPANSQAAWVGLASTLGSQTRERLRVYFVESYLFT